MNNTYLKQKELTLRLRYRLVPVENNSKDGIHYNLKIMSASITGENVFKDKVYPGSAAGFLEYTAPNSNDNFLQTFTCE